MTLLRGSNRGYFHPTRHVSALGESEEVCWIVAVCVDGEAWRRSVRQTPRRLLRLLDPLCRFYFAFLLR